jgi:formylglycine-generating enzyme required for sulfatase activity
VKVLLNQELFNRLSNTDKAALFVHEAAYKLFRDAVNATSSDDVRLLVGDLFAEGDQSAEIAQIVALVHKFVVLDESNLSFVSIPAGTFQMGSLVGEFGHNYFEALHTVTISRSFEMQATTVTQFQWFVEMGGNPSSFKDRKYCPEDYVEVRGTALCPNNPVENISWNDAQGFIQKLNARGDGYTYRLPTEAEWEYAARAKTQTSYYFGNNANVVGDYAWVGDNAGNQTHAVATKLPNNFGLYDMYGNVWQWVQDLDDAYPAGSVTDPSGPLSGTQRVLRGSGWSCYDARAFRSASRLASDPSHRGRNLGFRLVRTAAPQS